MIRAIWSSLQDCPDRGDPSRVHRSVIRLAVVGAETSNPGLIDQLTAEAIEELNAQPQDIGSCIFVLPGQDHEHVDLLPAGTSVSIVAAAPNEPLGVRLGSERISHTIRVPNAPLMGEAIVAVRACADLEFPAVLSLDTPTPAMNHEFPSRPKS